MIWKFQTTNKSTFAGLDIERLSSISAFLLYFANQGQIWKRDFRSSKDWLKTKLAWEREAMQEFGSHMDPLAVYFLGGWLELIIQDLPKASPSH